MANLTAGWTLRSATAALTCTAAAILILGIPFALLWGPRPRRFGWHMYTSVTVGRVWTEAPDGSLTAVDVRPMVATVRGDTDWPRLLGPALCRRRQPAAVVVEWRGRKERIPCR